jgi:DNA invertase Pin-like site-specific DNA recombinase
MATGKFVAYLRVSTQRQGRSGLGIEAQRKAVADYLNGGSWKLVSEHVETESGKRDDNRPELAAAMQACRIHGATLIIAKLDRLSRDAHFLLGLQKANVDFVAADMPDANKMTVGIMALVAQHEREAISRRTKEALAAAKARGQTLGNPDNLGNRQLGSERGNKVKAEKATAWARDLAPILSELRKAGIVAPQDMAAALTAKGIPTARKMAHWSPVQVERVLARLGEAG